jgi:hypothetical protein
MIRSKYFDLQGNKLITSFTRNIYFMFDRIVYYVRDIFCIYFPANIFPVTFNCSYTPVKLICHFLA